MSAHIFDLGSSSYWWQKYTQDIKFLRFYLLWDVAYKHLCDFLQYQKCDKHVTTPCNV